MMPWHGVPWNHAQQPWQGSTPVLDPPAEAALPLMLIVAMQVPAAVETGRGRATQDRQPLWTALNALLGLMDAPAMAHLLGCFPAFLDIALQLALTGTAVSWPALSILRHIFGTAQSQVRHGRVVLVNQQSTAA